MATTKLDTFRSLLFPFCVSILSFFLFNLFSFKMKLGTNIITKKNTKGDTYFYTILKVKISLIFTLNGEIYACTETSKHELNSEYIFLFHYM